MNEKFTCTHRQAVKRIAAYMHVRMRMAVVLAERVTTAVTETPDVLAWSSGGGSILVECKVSRADFHADKSKVFRREEERGVGQERYFAAPAGMLTADDMPLGWGLLEIHQHQIRVAVGAAVKPANKQAEVAMLVSAIRRLELAATVFVRHEANAPAPEACNA